MVFNGTASQNGDMYVGCDDDDGSGVFGIDLRRGLFMACVCSNTKFKQG